MWLLFAFLAPAFYALAEVLDNFLANRKFSRHPLTLAFYTSMLNLIFVPILFVFYPPEWPPLSTIPLFLGLGLVSVGYLYPYYRGLQTDDTSVVISFFAVGRIFVPILAFFIVGEVLNFWQYVGMGVIISSAVLLALHRSHAKFRFSKAMGYIGIAAFMLAFEGIFLKMLFEQGVSVSTAVGGESIMAIVFAFALLFIPHVRRDARASFGLFVKLSPLFLVEEFFTFAGLFTESKAISLTSLSVVKGITMASPFFIIIYAWLGHRMFPSLFKEDLHRRKVIHKLTLFALLILGILLVKE